MQLPALRERREDIPLLVQHFLEKYGEENNKTRLEITPEALDLLLEYDWPGNVRELENVIERAVVLSTGPRIDADLVPDHVRSSKPLPDAAVRRPARGHLVPRSDHRLRARLIESTLEAAGGVQKRAAELLHIKPTTLNEMIKRHDIRPRRKRRRARRARRRRRSRCVDAECSATATSRRRPSRPRTRRALSTLLDRRPSLQIREHPLVFADDHVPAIVLRT